MSTEDGFDLRSFFMAAAAYLALTAFNSIDLFWIFLCSPIRSRKLPTFYFPEMIFWNRAFVSCMKTGSSAFLRPGKTCDGERLNWKSGHWTGLGLGFALKNGFSP